MKRLLLIMLCLMPSLAHAQAYCQAFATTARVLTAATLAGTQLPQANLLPGTVMAQLASGNFYQISSGDFCQLLLFNLPQTTTYILLPTPGSAFIPTGYIVNIKNESTSGSLMLDTMLNPLTFYNPLLDTSPNAMLIPPGGNAMLYNNGTDWFTSGFGAPGNAFLTSLTFGTFGAGNPSLSTTPIPNALPAPLPTFINSQGTFNIAIYNPLLSPSLSGMSFAPVPAYLNGVCAYAPGFAAGKGPMEWLVITDPAGNKKSTPLC